MDIRLPEIETLEVSFVLPDNESLKFTLKKLTTRDVSENKAKIKEYEKEHIAGKLSYLELNFKILELGIENLDKSMKDRLSSIPHEYLEIMLEYLADTRTAALTDLKEAVKKNLSETAS